MIIVLIIFVILSGFFSFILAYMPVTRKDVAGM